MSNVYPKQAIAVLGSVEALENSIDRLQEAGFDQERISVLSRREIVEGKLTRTHSPIDAARLIDFHSRNAPVRKVEMNELRAAIIGLPAYVGAILAGTATVASGGLALPVILATAGGGAGGALLGGLLSRFLDRQRSNYFERQLVEGGILLWVMIDTPEDERRALEILPSFSIERITLEDTAVDAPTSVYVSQPPGM